MTGYTLTTIPHARNLRAAFAAGRNGWPSPEEIAAKNSRTAVATETGKEQEYWQKGRQVAQA